MINATISLRKPNPQSLRDFRYAVCIGASAQRPTMYLQSTLNMLAEGMIPPEKIIVQFDSDSFPYNDPPLVVPPQIRSRVQFRVPTFANVTGQGYHGFSLTYLRPTLFTVTCLDTFSGDEHAYPVITMEDDLLVSRDFGTYLAAFFRTWRLRNGEQNVFYHLYSAAFIHERKYLDDTFEYWYKK